jgi:hypothetical protein
MITTRPVLVWVSQHIGLSSISSLLSFWGKENDELAVPKMYCKELPVKGPVTLFIFTIAEDKKHEYMQAIETLI